MTQADFDKSVRALRTSCSLNSLSLHCRATGSGSLTTESKFAVYDVSSAIAVLSELSLSLVCRAFLPGT